MVNGGYYRGILFYVLPITHDTRCSEFEPRIDLFAGEPDACNASDEVRKTRDGFPNCASGFKHDTTMTRQRFVQLVED